MEKLSLLKELVKETRAVQVVDDDVYSVMVDSHHMYQYNKRAAVYDFMVDSDLYNRVMWGASVKSYSDFARQAISSHPYGLVLDAACGSLLFTAQSYAESSRPVIAFDQSLNMLRRARSRLVKLSPPVLERVVLLQADLSDMPFREKCFQTIISMNVLHHYADVTSAIRNLKDLLSVTGNIYLTSLVTNDRLIGDWYLSLLHHRGWLVPPRTKDDLRRLLQNGLKTSRFWSEGNMAYATIARDS